MRVLIVDDDVDLAVNIAGGLRLSGMETDVVTEIGPGVDLASAAATADVVVLDVMLGDADGLEVCRGLRRRGMRTPILMLTGLGKVADRVAGLEAGADDYLVKPFALEELTARVRALDRRHDDGGGRILEAGGLRMDTRERLVEVDGRPLRLTDREGTILECLLERLGRPTTQQALCERLSFEAPPGSNIVEVYVARLRRKLSESGARLAIVTLKRRGYVLDLVEPATGVA